MKTLNTLVALLVLVLVTACGQGEAKVLILSPNGTYSTKTTFAAAVAAADTAGKTIVVTEATPVSGTITVPSDRAVRVENGGYFSGTGGITFSGGSFEGVGYVFRNSGAVTGLATSQPELFGAAGDRSTLDTTAVQRAINATKDGGEVVFDSTRGYKCGALTLKSGLTYRGTSSLAYDQNITNEPTLVYSGSTGDFLSLVGAGSPANPVKGVAFRNLYVDGNNTTGAVIAQGAWRSTFDHCVIRRGGIGILYVATSAWAGENTIQNCSLQGNVIAVKGDGVNSVDNNLVDSVLFGGTSAAVLSITGGWKVSGNHSYAMTGAHYITAGPTFAFHRNYLDNIVTVGIQHTLDSAAGTVDISHNVFTATSANNVVAVDLIVNQTCKTLVTHNIGYYLSSLTGTIGVRTTGGATFYGSVLLNSFDLADTKYSFHSTTSTSLLDIDSQVLSTNATTFQLYQGGNGPVLRFTTSTNPEGAVTAEPGSIAIRNSGGVGYIYFKATGSGNTGWRRVYVNPSSGAGVPGTTPEYIGQEYFDSTNNKWYKAKGSASSADWLLLN